ncbi:MAG: hypothetical protein RR607_07875 [Akkermansia sp.]
MNEEQQFEQTYKEHVARRRAHLAAHITPETIAYLQAEFQTNLPCFQGTQGTYDPLDAMKRDAQREIILWLTNEINQHNKQTNNQ